MLTKMKSALIGQLASAALTIMTSSIPAAAQNGPADYRYCALDKSGATVCYFNSREACSSSGNGRCIANPWYTGDAFAHEPTGGRRNRPR